MILGFGKLYLQTTCMKLPMIMVTMKILREKKFGDKCGEDYNIEKGTLGILLMITSSKIL